MEKYILHIFETHPKEENSKFMLFPWFITNKHIVFLEWKSGVYEPYDMMIVQFESFYL